MAVEWSERHISLSYKPRSKQPSRAFKSLIDNNWILQKLILTAYNTKQKKYNIFFNWHTWLIFVQTVSMFFVGCWWQVPNFEEFTPVYTRAHTSTGLGFPTTEILMSNVELLNHFKHIPKPYRGPYLTVAVACACTQHIPGFALVYWKVLK